MTALLVAALATALATPAVIWTAHRWRLIDVPNHRSSHAAPVPRGGGIAIVVGVAIALAIGAELDRGVVAVAVGAAVLGVVGLVDDRVGLPALPRLAAQLVVPLLAAVVAIDRAGAAGAVAVVIAVVASVAYVNAFNFMDGINGIAASQAAITSLVIAVVADQLGEPSLRTAALALCGAVVAFLPFNAPRARIFLGDVGSYAIGAFLAGIALLAVDRGASVLTVLAPFLLYLADTGTVLAKRARRGASLFEAHREHAYQRLHQAGWSHPAVAGLAAAVSAGCSALMLATSDAAPSVRLACFAGCLLAVVAYLDAPRWVAARRARLTA